MQFCSIFSKPPVNALSYFYNLKNKNKREKNKPAGENKYNIILRSDLKKNFSPHMYSYIERAF